MFRNTACSKLFKLMKCKTMPDSVCSDSGKDQGDRRYRKSNLAVSVINNYVQKLRRRADSFRMCMGVMCLELRVYKSNNQGFGLKMNNTGTFSFKL